MSDRFDLICVGDSLFTSLITLAAAAAAPQCRVLAVLSGTAPSQPTLEPVIWTDTAPAMQALLAGASAHGWDGFAIAEQDRLHRRAKSCSLIDPGQLQRAMVRSVAASPATLACWSEPGMLSITQGRVASAQGVALADTIIDTRQLDALVRSVQRSETQVVTLEDEHQMQTPIFADLTLDPERIWPIVQYFPISATRILVRKLCHAGLIDAEMDIDASAAAPAAPSVSPAHSPPVADVERLLWSSSSLGLVASFCDRMAAHGPALVGHVVPAWDEAFALYDQGLRALSAAVLGTQRMVAPAPAR